VFNILRIYSTKLVSAVGNFFVAPCQDYLSQVMGRKGQAQGQSPSVWSLPLRAPCMCLHFTLWPGHQFTGCSFSCNVTDSFTIAFRNSLHPTLLRVKHLFL